MRTVVNMISAGLSNNRHLQPSGLFVGIRSTVFDLYPAALL
jgi:hypothetical protein